MGAGLNKSLTLVKSKLNATDQLENNLNNVIQSSMKQKIIQKRLQRDHQMSRDLHKKLVKINRISQQNKKRVHKTTRRIKSRK